MIAPCRECGGDSLEPEHEGFSCDGECCPRCAFMPWLSAMFYGVPTFRGEPTASTALDARGKWKPDPDTVIKWCFDHAMVPTHYLRLCDRECRHGWIEKPTAPLKTEEDR